MRLFDIFNILQIGVIEKCSHHLPKHNELEDSGWVRWEENPAATKNLILMSIISSICNQLVEKGSLRLF